LCISYMNVTFFSTNKKFLFFIVRGGGIVLPPTSSPSPMAQLAHWCFTLYNVPKVPSTDKRFKYCVYQKEKCPTTGKDHYQGYVEFQRSIRMKTIKELFGDDSIHLEARRGSRTQARDYCMKSQTALGEPVELGEWVESDSGNRVDLHYAREKILAKRKVSDCYEDPELDPITTKYPKWVEQVHSTKKPDYKLEIELYEWQKLMLEILKDKPQHRRIIWIWSTGHKTGKTTFMEWVGQSLDVLPADGNFADIMYAYDNNHVIWFDYTKHTVPDYETLEKFSNIGYKMSRKFHSLKKFVNSHIVVTSNMLPNEAKLPKRFHTVNVDPQDDQEDDQERLPNPPGTEANDDE